MRLESQKSKVLGLSIGAILLAATTIVKADVPPPPAPAEPAPAAESEKSWTAEVGADYFSQYIFRGVDLLHNNPVAVPHVALSCHGFGLYYYGYYGASGTKGNSVYEEQDWAGDYTHTLGNDKLSGTVGVIAYDYFDHKDGKNTVELYGVLAYSWDVLNPKILINWDIDEFHGGYGQAVISHDFVLTKCLKLEEPMTLTITPSAALGVDFGYNSRTTPGNVNWNDLLLGLSANMQLCKYVSAHAGVQFSVALNSLNDIGQHNETIANFGLKFVY